MKTIQKYGANAKKCNSLSLSLSQGIFTTVLSPSLLVLSNATTVTLDTLTVLPLNVNETSVSLYTGHHLTIRECY